MIRKPRNWNEVQEYTDRQKLPLDAYVCKVKQCKVVDTNYGKHLAILFDIAEGEYAGYFQKEFASNTAQDKKWRGVMRVWIPKDDGSDRDEMTKRIFKGMTTSFERSNPGYQWDWNESSLDGKTVGILFRNEEYDYQDKQGWAVRPFRAISADTVRDGEYTLPKNKPLKNKPITTSNSFVGTENDDLPF